MLGWLGNAMENPPCLDSNADAGAAASSIAATINARVKTIRMVLPLDCNPSMVAWRRRADNGVLPDSASIEHPRRPPRGPVFGYSPIALNNGGAADRPCKSTRGAL